MDLRKLPPSLLVVLGLACSRQPPTVGPCLSPPYDPGMDPPADTGDTGTTGEVPDDGGGDEPPVGPCLSPPAPQPDAAPGPSASVATADDVPDVATRREALERVLARATLPADVAARLRETVR